MILINGVKHWLWRAVDANGDTLDILVQMRCNAKAAKRFLARLIAQFGQPRVIIIDKLHSYIKPIACQEQGADHRAHKGFNNRIEGKPQADVAMRENHGALQVSRTGATISRRS